MRSCASFEPTGARWAGRNRQRLFRCPRAVPTGPRPGASWRMEGVVRKFTTRSSRYFPSRPFFRSLFRCVSQVLSACAANVQNCGHAADQPKRLRIAADDPPIGLERPEFPFFRTPEDEMFGDSMPDSSSPLCLGGHLLHRSRLGDGARSADRIKRSARAEGASDATSTTL
jgi:hypothetical protein